MIIYSYIGRYLRIVKIKEPADLHIPHGLDSGEHCERFSTRQIRFKFMIIKMFCKFNTMFL